MQPSALQNARARPLRQDMTVRISSKQLLTILLVVALGCNDGPSGLTTGNLSITVAGLPSGVSAAVTVTGPDGYNQPVPGSQTLTQLTPGIYTIAASNVSVGATTYAGTPASQTVSVGGSASASVIYSANSPTLGSLLVNINGLPSGANAAITVTSTNGFNQAVTTTQTLTSLAPGTYTISAQDVVAPGGTPYTASPATQDVGVTASATASGTVNYSPPSGGSLNLHIDGMYLTQSTQTYAGAVPLVQNRAGYLRVFVVANQINAATPSVRVRFYQDLIFQSEQIISAPGLAVPTAVDEDSLSNSWNISVPGTLIQPGLSIVAEVDPGNTVTESIESDNAFPSSGTQSLSVRTVPALNVTLVPVVQKGNGRTGNVSNPSAFMESIQKMHPVATINTVVHAPYTTTTFDTLQATNANSAWGTILGEIDLLRTAEQSSRYYYGVAKVSYSSGVAGVAYVSGPNSPERVALGWDYLPTGAVVAAHELAHNWARDHAPCGNPAGVDNNYPHPDGSIGVYGLDVATQTLKPPSSTDIMGYCDPKWIGDYTYTAVLNYLSPPASPVVMSAAGDDAVQPTLLVWGHISNGRMVLEPAFQLSTRPKLPQQAGPYSIEARASDGATLFNFSFAPKEVADAPGGQQNFVFAVPLTSASIARISTLRLSAPGRQVESSSQAAGSRANARFNIGGRPDSIEVRRVTGGRVGLRWNARVHPMIMVRDAASGEILSLARGGDVQLSTIKDDVELLVSDGVKSRVKRVSLRQ
jgi:hypothetical protein